jgi:hypothetical protein
MQYQNSILVQEFFTCIICNGNTPYIDGNNICHACYVRVMTIDKGDN